MQGFDVLLCPSVYEGFGNVVLEAQAAGTAAVVSDRLTPDVDMGLGLSLIHISGVSAQRYRG